MRIRLLGFLFFGLILQSSVGLAALTASPSEVYQHINRGYEAQIRPILEKSCTACHSSSGKMPWFYQVPLLHDVMNEHVQAAREHLELTPSFPFRSRRTATEDLQLLAATIRMDLMPPTAYRWTHLGSELTASEKK